jgi:hypothetical protein
MPAGRLDARRGRRRGDARRVGGIAAGALAAATMIASVRSIIVP